MPKIVYDAARGLVQETGSGVVFNSDSISFTTLPTSAVQAITTTSQTISSAGVYTVSGTSALTTFVPDPSSIPGGNVIVRAISNKAHILTGSANVAGVNIFAGRLGGPVREGTMLTFAGVREGESVSLVSDGRVYLLTGMSGSCTITLPA